jgi:flagellin-like protein
MKGVSPLVATVMLIVIVVSLVALISGWLTQMFTESREIVSNRQNYFKCKLQRRKHKNQLGLYQRGRDGECFCPGNSRE